MMFDRTFKSQDFTKIRLPKGDFENCIFDSCDFSNALLDDQIFLECQFSHFSNANITNSTFNDVLFTHCKMMGLKFETLNEFLREFRFDHCTLNLSSFYRMTLKNQKFEHCKLIGTDFSEAVLTDAVFDHCDLQNALFDNTVLEKSDFRTANNFSVDPIKNRIKHAKFSQENALTLLDTFNIVIE